MKFPPTTSSTKQISRQFSLNSQAEQSLPSLPKHTNKDILKFAISNSLTSN